MNSDLHGRKLRSVAKPFVLGDQQNVELNFLAPARHMTAPEVARLTVVFQGTVTPVGANALGKDAAKLFSEITFRDETEMIKASGQSLRLLEQVEMGSRQQDPADVVLGAPVVVTYRLNIHLMPSPNRAVRPRDFTVPITNFLEGGNFIINTAGALPSNWGAVGGDWKVQVHAHVIDGRVRELKSRRRILEQSVSQQEFRYPTNGSIRGAFLTSKLLTTGATSWAAFSTLYSSTLDLPPSYDTHVLIDEYRMNSESLGANDEIINANAIPLIFPQREKKIGTMIDSKDLHIDLLAAAPANAKLLTDVVVDRPPNITATAEGYGSPEALSAAVAAHGWVVGEGSNYPARNAPPALGRRLPIRIKAGR